MLNLEVYFHLNAETIGCEIVRFSTAKLRANVLNSLQPSSRVISSSDKMLVRAFPAATYSSSVGSVHVQQFS